MNRRALLFLLACFVAATACSTVAIDRFKQCGSYEQEMAQVWNEQARGQVRQAAAQAGHPDSDKLAAVIDKFAAMWIAAREEACDAAKIKDKRERAAYAACLDANRLHLRAYVEMVTLDSPALAGNARLMFSSVLRDFYSCRNTSNYRVFLNDLALKDRAKMEAAEVAGKRAALLAWFKSDDRLLEAEAEHALQAAQAAGSKRLVAYAKLIFASTRIRQERFDEARAYLDSTEQLFRELAFPYGLAEAAWIRGYLAIAEDDQGKILPLFQEGLDKSLAAVGRKDFLVGYFYVILATVQFDEHEEEALAAMRQAVAISRELQEVDGHFLAECLEYLGIGLLNQGRFNEAADLFEEALTILREDPPDQGEKMDNLEAMILTSRKILQAEPPEENRP